MAAGLADPEQAATGPLPPPTRPWSGPEALRPVRRSTELCLLAVMLAAFLALGVRLVLTSPLMAKDGVGFIEIARQLQQDPAKTIGQGGSHVGYPFLVMACHRLVARLGLEGPQSWVLSGQIVSLTFRILTLLGAYLIARELAGQRAALLGLLIVGLLPLPAEYGSDVLSDYPCLALVFAGYWVFVRAAAANRPMRLAWVGLLAALAYWVRPEGAFPVVVALPWAAWRACRSKTPPAERLRWLTGAGAMVVILVGCTLPHVLATGMLYPEKRLFPLHAGKPSAAPASAPSTARAPRKATPPAKTATAASQAVSSARKPDLSKLREAVARWANRVGGLLLWYDLIPLGIGAGIWFVDRRMHRPHTLYFAIAFWVLYTAICWFLYIWQGYISHRHAMPQVLLSAGCLGLAVVCPANLAARWLSRIRPSFKAWQLPLSLALGLALSLPMLYRTLRPARSERDDLLKAIEWLKDNARPGEPVLASDPRVPMMAGLACYPTSRWCAFQEPNTARSLWYDLKRSKARFAAVRHKPADPRDRIAGMILQVGPKAFEKLASWSDGDAAVVIYRLHPDRADPQPPPAGP